MSKRKKQNVSDDNVTSEEEIHYFDPLPVDLVINILSRLPLKSIAKCRCVSKLWSSIIRRPNHDQLFPIKSPATPRLLFIGELEETPLELFFYSSPHPQSSDKTSSSIELRHLRNSVTEYCRLCPPVAGLVCRQKFGENCTFAVISNPVTGEYVTTPKVTTERFNSKTEIYFGYDPIEKIFKVLCMTYLPHEYLVLTLGTGTPSWRNIQCGTLNYPQEEDKGICINGVLYYTARIHSKKRVIVCFDVRSEKFSFIDIPNEYLATHLYEALILIDYNGKLGVIFCDIIQSDSFALWVLKDAEEHKWSQHFSKMHLIMSTSYVCCAGMIGSDEIVLYDKHTPNYFDIFCYNLERNVITRVEIPLLDDSVEYCKVHTFSNFVEDAKLMF